MPLLNTRPMLDPVKSAARQIRAKWTERERNFRRKLARVRAQLILQMIENSVATAN